DVGAPREAAGPPSMELPPTLGAFPALGGHLGSAPRNEPPLADAIPTGGAGDERPPPTADGSPPPVGEFTAAFRAPSVSEPSLPEDAAAGPPQLGTGVEPGDRAAAASQRDEAAAPLDEAPSSAPAMGEFTAAFRAP